MPTKKTIVVPCIVNMRLKTCGETKSLCGTHELDAHDRRFNPADHEEDQRIARCTGCPAACDRRWSPIRGACPRADEMPRGALGNAIGLSRHRVASRSLSEASPGTRSTASRSCVAQPHRRHQRSGLDGVRILESTAADSRACCRAAPEAMVSRLIRCVRSGPKRPLAARAGYRVAVDAGGGLEDAAVPADTA